MRILKSVALVAGLTGCLGAQAELINYQEAIEASDLRVSASADGKGYVHARGCSSCKSMKLEITPATIIMVDGKPAAAGKGISRHWAGGVVIYDVETKQVVRLDL